MTERPRITLQVVANSDGGHEVLLSLNPLARDKLVKELVALNERNDHFHVFSFEDWDGLQLSEIPYAPGDRLADHFKVLLRPDHWDREYYPHVMAEPAAIKDNWLKAVEETLAIAQSRAAGRVPVIGIAGAQGSGKTTLLRSFAAASGERIAGLSLDDVYLGLAERRALGERLHPLFRTRGVPGTHDVALFHQTLDALQGAHDGSVTSLPVFDKAIDDRAPLMVWPSFVGKPSLIIVDGWCLGATPQPPEELAQQINALEERDDPDGVWRSEVNGFLRSPYQEAFARLDAILFLEAPSFDVVLDWRCEQEAGLLKRELREADRARIAHFIAHYERITRHMLVGGVRADVTAELDAKRQVAAIRHT